MMRFTKKRRKRQKEGGSKRRKYQKYDNDSLMTESVTETYPPKAPDINLQYIQSLTKDVIR